MRPEDTLYSIAWRHDLDYRDLARWNNIGADFRISVGQVLVLGPAGCPCRSTRRTARRTAGCHGAAGRGGCAAGQQAAAIARCAAIDAASAVDSASTAAGSGAQACASTVGQPRRRNPQRRSCRRHPSVRPPPARRRNGFGRPTGSAPLGPCPAAVFLLSGRLGQDVRAASAGRVVYTGSGLRGYGNLIIIKHADSVLSAYAHNREMLVHDGQDVATGQVIAHMGEGSRTVAGAVLRNTTERQTGRSAAVPDEGKVIPLKIM